MSGVKGRREGPSAPGPVSAPGPAEAAGPEEITELNVSVSPRGKAKIVRMLKGKLGDFIPASKIRNPNYVDRDAIQIFFETEDGRHFRETFTLSTAANSKLRRFIGKYGPPKVGMEVEYQEDSRGFPRIVL